MKMEDRERESLLSGEASQRRASTPGVDGDGDSTKGLNG